MKMKTHVTLFMMLILSVMSAQTAFAGEMKIGVVDFQQVLEKSTVIRGLNSQLEEKVRTEEGVITKKREALQARKEEFDKQQTLLDAGIRAEKEDQLRQELKELQRYANDKQEEFQRRGSELMQDILKKLGEIVKEIAEEEGYTLILERSTGGLVYSDSSLEITEKVFKEYDKRNKK